MASNDWHKLNNILGEIERSRAVLNEAVIHCSFNKNSAIKSKIDSMRDAHYALYDKMYDQATIMLEKSNDRKKC